MNQNEVPLHRFKIEKTSINVIIQIEIISISEAKYAIVNLIELN